MPTPDEGGLIVSDLPRCGWVGEDELYCEYHDRQWGVAVHDERLLFEFLILEGFQAGLSWLTILKKRENFRKAFLDWDYNKLQKLSDQKIEKILTDRSIIRNRLKVTAVRENARAFMRVQKEHGSFDNFIWGYTDGQTIIRRLDNWKEYPAKSELSEQISKDMKKLGFKFCGPVIIYSYLQAIGIIDDHMQGCHRAH